MSCWFITIAEHGANYTKESLLQSERRATWPTVILDGTARIEFVQPENWEEFTCVPERFAKEGMEALCRTCKTPPLSIGDSTNLKGHTRWLCTCQQFVPLECVNTTTILNTVREGRTVTKTSILPTSHVRLEACRMRLARNGRLIVGSYSPDIMRANLISWNRSAMARFAGSLLRRSILLHHHSGDDD